MVLRAEIFGKVEGINDPLSNNAIWSGFILLKGTGKKGGAHSVSSDQAEDKDIAKGWTGV